MENNIIEWFFMGMTQSKELVSDKDTMNAMEEDFKNTSIHDFVQEMYYEMRTFEPEHDEELKQFITGSGVITREFFEYKVNHPDKKDESPKVKPIRTKPVNGKS